MGVKYSEIFNNRKAKLQILVSFKKTIEDNFMKKNEKRKILLGLNGYIKFYKSVISCIVKYHQGEWTPISPKIQYAPNCSSFFLNLIRF